MSSEYFSDKFLIQSCWILNYGLQYPIFLTTFFSRSMLEKSVPGLADVGVPHGDEDGLRTPAPGSGSKIYECHVDQHEKLKGLDVH